MTTPYKDKLGKDLDNVFEPLEDNTKASKTNYRVDGSDLNDRYASVVDGNMIDYNTGYRVNGTDLKEIFAKKGSILGPEADFTVALAPQPPGPSARAHFSGGLMNTFYIYGVYSQMFVSDWMSEFVGIGDYPSNWDAFPNAIKASFDAIAVDAGVRCVIYSLRNFEGDVLFDRIGPFMLWNSIWDGTFPMASWKDGREDPQQPGVTYESIFPPGVRLFSDSNMHLWAAGSMKLRKI